VFFALTVKLLNIALVDYSIAFHKPRSQYLILLQLIALFLNATASGGGGVATTASYL
jgi:hypothetical protein